MTKAPHPRPLSDLALKYCGRAAVIIGGGMSLPEQIKLAPAGAVHLGANEHACKLGIRCDYIVCVDEVQEKVKPWGVPIISNRRWADYRMFKQPVTNSGACAAFCAWVMGCAPIVLVGMDCYVGGTYCHDPKARSSGNAVSLQGHLGRWERLKGMLPRAAIRSAGGPTQGVFPAYNPAETAFTIPTVAEVLRQCSGVLVDITKRIEFGPHVYAAGERAVELSEAEVRHAKRLNAAVVASGASRA